MKYIHRLLLLCIIMSLTLVGCTSVNLKSIVNEYVDKNKSGKIEYIKEYGLKLLYGKNVDKNKVPKEMDEALDKYISTVKVNVLSQEINQDEAIVMAEVTATDFIEKYFKLRNEYIISVAEGNSSHNRDEIEIFNQSLANGSNGTRRKAIRFTKENKKWNLDEESLAKAIFNMDIDTSFRLYLSNSVYDPDEISQSFSISQSKRYTELVLGTNIKEIDRQYDENIGEEVVIYRVDDYNIRVNYINPYKYGFNIKPEESDRSKVVFISFRLDEDE